MAAAPGTGWLLWGHRPALPTPPSPRLQETWGWLLVRSGWDGCDDTACAGGRSTYHGSGEGTQVGRLSVVGEPVVLVEGHSILRGQSQSQRRCVGAGAPRGPSRPVRFAFPKTGHTCAHQTHHPSTGNLHRWPPPLLTSMATLLSPNLYFLRPLASTPVGYTSHGGQLDF